MVSFGLTFIILCMLRSPNSFHFQLSWSLGPVGVPLFQAFTLAYKLFESYQEIYSR